MLATTTCVGKVARNGQIPPALHAIAWTIASGLGFALLNMLLGIVALQMPPLEVQLLRYFAGLILWYIALSHQTLADITAIGFASVLGSVAHYCATSALRGADASATQGVQFLDLIWMTTMGFWRLAMYQRCPRSRAVWSSSGRRPGSHGAKQKRAP